LLLLGRGTANRDWKAIGGSEAHPLASFPGPTESRGPQPLVNMLRSAVDARLGVDGLTMDVTPHRMMRQGGEGAATSV